MKQRRSIDEPGVSPSQSTKETEEEGPVSEEENQMSQEDEMTVVESEENRGSTWLCRATLERGVLGKRWNSRGNGRRGPGTRESKEMLPKRAAEK